MAAVALTPATVRIRPADAKYRAENRLWQGIPGIERTKNGTMYVILYSGEKTEGSGNFILVTRGREELPMDQWEDAFLVIEHEEPMMRCFDPCLWIDPLGRLWVMWTQSYDFFDGRDGVWAVVAENPDDETPVFSAPRRIANGLMMNKPVALSTGEWLFPAAIWSHEVAKPVEEHPELAAEVGSNVYVTRDQGKTFEFLGGADTPGRFFDEHMVVEKKDGSLWMLIRMKYGIGESTSTDGGRTWTTGRKTGIAGPNSRFFVRRLRSGRLLMVSHLNFRNQTDNRDGFAARNNLVAQLSEDDGRTWIGALVLDTRNAVSYPDGIEDETGLIRIVYDYERYKDREVLVAAFREEDVLEGMLISPDGYLRRVVSKATGCAE